MSFPSDGHDSSPVPRDVRGRRGVSLYGESVVTVTVHTVKVPSSTFPPSDSRRTQGTRLFQRSERSELRLVQLAITAGAREQLGMCSALDDLAAIDHED